MGILNNMRVGIGYDIHRFTEGRKLVIGGVEIDFPKGLLGHSDADVLIHAIIDAMLGCVGESDIGTQFPDDDPAYKGISSIQLLKKTGEIFRNHGKKIINIDSVIIAESPKLNEYIPSMKRKISMTLEILESKIGIKAKTNEKTDAIGKGEAIASYAVILVEDF